MTTSHSRHSVVVIPVIENGCHGGWIASCVCGWNSSAWSAPVTAVTEGRLHISSDRLLPKPVEPASRSIKFLTC